MSDMAGSDIPFLLGRHLWHDPRNRDHRALSIGVVRPDRRSLWFASDVFDQAESNCTIEAAIGVCRSGPVRSAFTAWGSYDTEPERVAFYRACQRFDPPEWGAHDGSASDSPYKGLRELGQITGWKWLFGIDEVRQWVMYEGPCSVGTTWLQSMFAVDEHGFIVVDRTSPVAGGHEWRIVGFTPSRRAYRMVNSWGRDWGRSGRAWIAEDDLDWLLHQNGDAVTVAL